MSGGEHVDRVHLAVDTLLGRGWQPLILRSAVKGGSPFAGTTGFAGSWPSRDELHRGVDALGPRSGLAIRLRPDQVAVDVDAHGDKGGAETVLGWEHGPFGLPGLGALPETWQTTSRPRTESGIRVYRVPEGYAGRRWIDPGPGVEALSWCWRYAIVSPTRHDRDGHPPYGWLDPAGRPCASPPNVADVPELPVPWAAQFSAPVDHVRAAYYGADATRADLSALGFTDGPPCSCVEALRDESYEAGMRRGPTGSAHVDLRSVLLRLVSRGRGGCTGAEAAIREAVQEHRLLGERTSDGHRREADAWRMIAGAIDLTTDDDPWPCADLGRTPWPGVLAERSGGEDDDDDYWP